jgi:hypothetical protein
LYNKETPSKKRKLEDIGEEDENENIEVVKNQKSSRKNKKHKLSSNETSTNNLFINKCLEILPYEGPFDSFQFIFKSINKHI